MIIEAGVIKTQSKTKKCHMSELVVTELGVDEKIKNLIVLQKPGLSFVTYRPKHVT